MKKYLILKKKFITKKKNKFAPIKEDELNALFCDIDKTTPWKLDRVNSIENHDFTIFPFGKHFFEKDEENNFTRVLHYEPETKEDVMKKFFYNLDLVNEANRFENVGNPDKAEFSDDIKEMEEYIASHTLEEIYAPEGRYFFVNKLRNILMTDYHMYQDKEGLWQYDNEDDKLDD